MHFTKMHGAGNDFVIISNMDGQISRESMPGLAAALCAPHTGVGADGCMIVVPAVRGGDYGMIFFNSDGSEGEMCGNGARCIARYGHDKGLAGEQQRVETISGTVLGQRLEESRYRVRLNDPAVIELSVPLQLDGQDYRCCYIEMGVPGLPHAVVYLQDYDDMDGTELKRLGSRIRHYSAFPKGANVTFVKKLGDNYLQAVTYERGVEDFTLACGTGCGSTAAALSLWGEVDPRREVIVDMPGGRLSIRLQCGGDWVRDIYLTGPTVTVFEGDYLGR